MYFEKISTTDMVKRIDSLLEERGLLRADLIKACELSESALRRWLSGSCPASDSLYKVAKYLNTTMEYLLDGKIELKEQSSLSAYKIVAEESLESVPKEEKRLLTEFEKLNESDRTFIQNLTHKLYIVQDYMETVKHASDKLNRK